MAEPAGRPPRRRWTRFVVWTLVGTLLLLAGLIHLAGRTATLHWVLDRAGTATGGRLQVGQASGSLLGAIEAGTIRWQSDGVTIGVADARLAYQPMALVDRRLQVDRLEARRLEIDLPAASAPAADPAPIRLPRRIALPMPIAIGRLAVAEVVVRRDGAEIARIENAEAVFVASDERAEVSGLAFDIVAGKLRIGVRGLAAVIPAEPYSTEVRLQARVPLEPQPLRVDLRADGPLRSLDARATTQWAGARMAVRTTVQSLDPRPLRQVKVELADLDLSRLAAGLPQSRIDATLAADMFPAWAGQDRRPVFVGPLKVTNAFAGPFDARMLPVATADALLSLADGRFDLQSIKVAGDAGEIAGRAWWSPQGFGADVASEGLRLQAIDSSLQPRTVQARLNVGTSGPVDARGIDIDLRASDPEVVAAVEGRWRDDWLTLSKADLSLRQRVGGANGAKAANGANGANNATGAPVGRAAAAPRPNGGSAGSGRAAPKGPAPVKAAPKAASSGGPRPVATAATTAATATTATTATAMVGSASVAGRIQTAPPFAMDLRGTVSGFEPHRLVRMPDAVLNGRLAVAGELGAIAPVAPAAASVPVPANGAKARGATPSASSGNGPGQLRFDLAVADSRIADLPFSGQASGRLTLAPRPAGKPAPAAPSGPPGGLGQIGDVVADLRWGATRVQLGGGLGEAASELEFALAARELGQWLPGAGGRLEVRGRLRGRFDALALDARADAQAFVLAMPGRRITADQAIVVAKDLRIDGSLIDADARVTRLRVADAAAGAGNPSLVELSQFHAQLNGSLAQHEVTLKGEGPGQRIDAAASGGLQGGTPSGGASGGRASAGSASTAGASAAAPSPGGEVPRRWSGRVTRLALAHRLLALPANGGAAPSAPSAVGAWRATRPFGLEAGAGTLAVADLQLLQDGTTLELPTFAWRPGLLELKAQLTGVPGQGLLRLAGFGGSAAAAAPTTARANGGGAAPPAAVEPLRLGARLAFRGDPEDPTASDWDARLTVNRESGDVLIDVPAAPNGRIVAGLGRLDLDLALQARQLRANLQLDGEQIGGIVGEAQTTFDASGQPIWSDASRARSPLAGKLAFSIPSFRWVSPVIGDAWRVDGALSANLALGGTLAAPRVDGAVTGANLSAEEQALGMRLTDGVLAAEFNGDRVDVKVLRMQSGEGSVSMSGLLQAARSGGSVARVRIDQLPIPLGVGQRVVLSGDASAVLEGSELRIGGRLVADEGVIELRGGSAPKVSGDVVIVDGDGKARPVSNPGKVVDDKVERKAFAVSSDVEIDLGQRFRVFGSGVEAKLVGALNLRGSLPDRPRAIGTVEIRDGTYQIYGRKLEIKKGKIVFNGPLDNPTLDIVAIRPYLKVEPGVEISGTAALPQVKLTSTPEVSDAEKLSWLVLGTGLDDAQGSGQLLVLQAAATTLFGDEDAKYADSLTEKLGIDMLSIREDGATASANAVPGAQSGAQGAVVMVGKRLSNRLFVTYEQSLRGVWNILKLQYDISNRLSLSVQAGSDSAADLLWFFPFD